MYGYFQKINGIFFFKDRRVLHVGNRRFSEHILRRYRSAVAGERAWSDGVAGRRLCSV